MEQISQDLYDALEGQKAGDEALNKVRLSCDVPDGFNIINTCVYFFIFYCIKSVQNIETEQSF